MSGCHRRGLLLAGIAHAVVLIRTVASKGPIRLFIPPCLVLILQQAGESGFSSPVSPTAELRHRRFVSCASERERDRASGRERQRKRATRIKEAVCFAGC